MSTKVLCDICGEPINIRQHEVKMRLESRTYTFGLFWNKLDICVDCAFKIKRYVKDKNEFAEDYIQVIRCKDCGNCKERIDGSLICNVTSIRTSPLDYCSHAFKSEGNNNLILPSDPLGPILHTKFDKPDYEKEKSNDS